MPDRTFKQAIRSGCAPVVRFNTFVIPGFAGMTKVLNVDRA
jgi:hypothetical protein